MAIGPVEMISAASAARRWLHGLDADMLHACESQARRLLAPAHR